MLNQMRALSQNWIGRSVMAVVLGFIIISFAIWGIGDRFSNFNASELAKVGQTSLSVDAYRNAYQLQLQQLERSQKRGITNEEARRLGLDRQVLAQLLRNTLLDQEGKSLGLAVGDTEIAKSIAADSMFKGANGQFDRPRFEELMRDNGLTEARYVREQRASILRQDVADAVTAELALPELMRSDIHAFQAEVRDFDYVILPPSAAGPQPAPSAADLQAFYDSHPAAFSAPEYRKLVVLSIVPANLVKPDAVSDADVEKRYDQVKAVRFGVPEKRTVDQLVFPTPATADAARAKLDGGESFDKLVADEKKTPADVTLGTIAKGDLADPAVAEAAFSLPEGGTSKPVKGQFGTVLVHVAKVIPGRQQPLQEVSAQLKDEMAIIKARTEASDDRTTIEDGRAAGKTLAESAGAVGLKPRTIEAIDAKGFDKAHKPVEGLADGPALLKAAFASDIGADNDMLQTADGGYVWYEVAGVEAAHREPLAQVKPQVEAAWRAQETDRRLAAAADKIVAAINGGTSLESVAADNGKLQIMRAQNVGRGGAPSLPPAAAAAVFSVAVGKAGSTSERSLGRMVFLVRAARVPPVDARDEQFNKLIDQVKSGFEDDVLAQYLAQLQNEIGVRINQQALQSALGTDSGS